VIDFARIVRARKAAEDALGVIVTANVTKALDPLDREDFLRIASQVATALQNDARPYEVSAVARAIDAISGVEWASLTREEMNAAIDAIRSITNDVGKVVMPSVGETFRIAGGQTMAATRESSIRRFGFEIQTSLAQRDLVAERWIRSLNTLYVRDAYGVRADDLAAVAREIVTNGVEQGLGSSTIAERLAETVGARIAQPASYWQVIATAFSNTGRTFSQLGSFRDAGITSYQFEAVLDEVTCFGAGTRVKMANGRERKIENVRAGDLVMSCRGIPRRVTALRIFAKRTWGTVRLSTGRTMRVTPNHPVLTARGWVRAGQLESNDRIVAYDRRNVSKLWDVARTEADRPSEGGLRSVPSGYESSAASLSYVRADVSARSEFEERIEAILLGRVQSTDDDVLALRDFVSNAPALPKPWARALLLRDMQASGVREGRSGIGSDEDVQAMPMHVLDLAGGSDLGQDAGALLEGVSEGDRDARVRVLREDLRAEARAGGDGAVLLAGVLPEARGRDEHRADGSTRSRIRRLPLRDRGEDRSVVGGLPSGRDDRSRSRRGVLAREAVSQGARCEAGRRDGEGGLPRDPIGGARGEGGPAMCDPRLAGLWPYPARELAELAKFVEIESIDWELTASDEPAYDIEVEEDAGYIAEGVIVHNTDQCRFYHGQTFNVGESVARIESLTQLTDPEAVKNENPWIRTGRDEEGNRILYFTRDGERTTIATIERSGVGARDDRGSYSGAASASQLSGFGIPWPPLHGNCRSTILPVL